MKLYFCRFSSVFMVSAPRALPSFRDERFIKTIIFCLFSCRSTKPTATSSSQGDDYARVHRVFTMGKQSHKNGGVGLLLLYWELY
jgi:hypothetical protein